MKKFYFGLFFLALASTTLFSQNLVKLSPKHAKRLAEMRNYNEWERINFINKATTVGVVLKPEYSIPTVRQPNASASTAVNLDFESQNFTGWSGNYTTSNCSPSTPNVRNMPGLNFTAVNGTSDQHGICTTGNDPSVTTGTLTCVYPGGGLSSCRLGDVIDGCGAADLSQSFVVTLPDTLITINYALIMYDGHPPQDAPKFQYTLTDSTGAIIDYQYLDATQAASPGSGFYSIGGGLYYMPWTARTVSLSPYVGQNITLQFITSDCNGGAHRGYAYIDCKLGGPSVCGNVPNAITCFVTTNDSMKNEIFFNHNATMPNGSGTIIFRKNVMNTWDSIGYVPATQPDVFVDTAANPNQQAYTYCVSGADSCGTLYVKSSAHTTVFLQSSIGTNNSVNLSWNAYVGAPVASYYIYRGTTPANMTLLNQVSNSTFAFTDLNPPVGSVYYKIKFTGPSCSSNAPHDTLVGSNFKVNSITGISQINVPARFEVYPSPAKDVLYIESNLGNVEFLISDALGKVVKTISAKPGKTDVDIKNLANGIYFITVKNGGVNSTLIKKIEVQN